MSKLKVNEIEAYNEEQVTINSKFTFSEDATFNKDVTVKGNLILGDMNTDTVEFVADINSHFLPEESSSWNIGSSIKKWNDLWLSGSADIAGTGNITTLVAGTGNITTLVAGTGQITGEFRVDGPHVGGDYLRVKSDTGRIGLGTADPTYDLELARDADVQTDFVITGETNVFAKLGKTSGGEGRLHLYNMGSIGGSPPNPPTCAINAAAGLNSWINSGANFGVGTSEPNSILHLESSSYTLQQFTRNDASILDGDTLGGLLFGGTTDGGGTYDYDSAVIIATAEGAWDTAALDSGSKLQFRTTKDGSSTNDARMTIRGDGKVGIGTEEPYHLLHLESTGTWLYQQFTRNDASINDGDTLGGLLFGGTTDGGGAYDYNSASIIAKAEGTWDTAASDSGSKLQFNTTPDGDNTHSTQMTIRGDGKVGIGTEEPTALLHVNGDTIIEGDLTVNGTTTTLNTETMTVDDNNIVLNDHNVPVDEAGVTGADGGGITLRGATDKVIAWQNSTDRWHFNRGISVVTGSVGIGTTDPSALLHTVDGAIKFEHSSSNLLVDFESNDSAIIKFTNNGVGESTIFRTNRYFRFDTGDGVSNVLILNASGNVGIGTASPEYKLHVQDGSASVMTNSADNAAKSLKFNKSRGAEPGVHAVVNGGDALGALRWYGSDGSNWVEAAKIVAVVNGTPGSADMPGKLLFLTTSDGSAAPAARMVIDNAGYVGVGITVPTALLHVDGNAIVAGTISGVTNPVQDQDVATKNYVDAAVTAEDLDFRGDDATPLSIDLDSEVLSFIGGTGVTTTGATNSLTIATDSDQGHVTNVGTLLSLDVAAGASITGIISGVTDPVAAQDVATKNYVDAAVTAEDLDFQGDDATPLSIDLDSEVLSFIGGTGVTTAGLAKTLTINTDADQGHVTNVGTLLSLDVAGNLVVDTDTLYVLSAGDKVGVRTIAPTSSLGIDGSISLPVATVASVAYNADVDDYTILGNTAGAGGDITVTLPNPALCGGRIYNIKKISGIHDVIINPSAGLIDGAATKTISTTWVSVTIQSNGTNWFIL